MGPEGELALLLRALAASWTSVRAQLAAVVGEDDPCSVRDAEAAWLRVEGAIEATYDLLRRADGRPAHDQPLGVARPAVVTDGVRQVDPLPISAEDVRQRAGSLASLTRREREVLSLLMDGRTNRQIAAALFITEKTAGGHVSSILAKLGASSRLQAASIAMRAVGGDGRDRGLAR